MTRKIFGKRVAAEVLWPADNQHIFTAYMARELMLWTQGQERTLFVTKHKVESGWKDKPRRHEARIRTSGVQAVFYSTDGELVHNMKVDKPVPDTITIRLDEAPKVRRFQLRKADQWTADYHEMN